jgi:hopanoid biosynthesis associated radical SAM protein HpnH
MRFPPGLYLSLAGAWLRNRFSHRGRSPFVLMLEPTHNCNLNCVGCDRIRLFRSNQATDLTLYECIQAVEESGAPVVTVTGGEPLLYPHLKPLLQRLLAMNRYVYLCTNGLLMDRFLEEWNPHPRLMLNFHLDGMALSHDSIAGREGVFDRAIAGLRKACRKGFNVCTNTSIYKNSNGKELNQLFLLVSRLGVKGILVSPAFAYESVGDDLFLDRTEIRNKFRAIHLSSLRFLNTPIYLQFLRGERDLRCSPWGSPTRNPFGWKSPCYLITDGYYSSFGEMMEGTDWEAYGTEKDPRCRNCMVHCGYEPSVMSHAFAHPADLLRLVLWNLELV